MLGNLDLALVETLFDHMPECPFFVKNKTLQYVAVNKAMIQLCGAHNREEVLGQRVSNFFSGPESLRYEAMDRKVLKTGNGITDKLEISFPESGRPVWLHFSRLPVTDSEGKTVGIIGTARRFKVPKRKQPIYQRLGIVISHIQENFTNPLNLQALGSLVGVSTSQIERDFFQLFRLTPQQYLTRVRIDRALVLLSGDMSISTIAQECGYADHSAFSRRFKATIGMTPSRYRYEGKNPVQTVGQDVN